ncbi:helix-hairpin-helix domain-containing protein [Clavibacter nebraskensis]|uniref:helix-hairpin-helix domain-containing protein n=1 Tax=Clavibacter nebraskensis TaxID=31963 RepID=UPI00200E631A|nr:ComEA family DNA-binding protein [Clavibacter nebraskensis]
MRPLRRARPEAADQPAWTGDGSVTDGAWPSDVARPWREPPGGEPADEEPADEEPADEERVVEDVPAPRAPADARPLPGQRVRVRLRVGVGAAAVLVGAALVGTILVTAIQSAGDASPTAPAAARPSSGANASAGSGASDASAHGDAAGDTGDEDTAGGGGGGAEGGASADGARTPIYVHVVGAVVSPGLFPLAPGSRVVDALAAAHGFADGADTAGVNLARVLSDGEQLVVPRQGETPTAAPAGPAVGGAGSASPSAPVDLNTATAEQLETLPRVGPSLAARIIAWRSAHGRFARIADLGRVPGIGDRTLASLTPLVRV